jgi:hypothetical protein
MPGVRRSPFVFCQYADDVRREYGDKVSIMGVYQGGLRVVGTLPVVLPRLMVLAHFVSPVHQPFTTVTFRVLWNGAVLHEIPAPEALIEQMSVVQDPTTDTHAIQMVIALQPFTMDASGKLEVVVDADGSTIPGNALRIEVVAPEAGDTPAPPAGH